MKSSCAPMKRHKSLAPQSFFFGSRAAAAPGRRSHVAYTACDARSSCFYSFGSQCLNRFAAAVLVAYPIFIVGDARLLSHTRFAQSPDVAGITWLDIFVLSLACCDQPHTIMQRATARVVRGIAHQLREFVTEAHEFAKLALPEHVSL